MRSAPHGFAGDDLAADGGLDRDDEKVRRDQILQLLAHGAATHFGPCAMHQHRERIHRLGIDQHRELDEVALAIFPDLVVEAGIAAADALEAVVEIEHHLVERQVVDELGARADIGEIDLLAARRS